MQKRPRTRQSSQSPATVTCEIGSGASSFVGNGRRSRVLGCSRRRLDIRDVRWRSMRKVLGLGLDDGEGTPSVSPVFFQTFIPFYEFSPFSTKPFQIRSKIYPLAPASKNPFIISPKFTNHTLTSEILFKLNP